MFKPVDAKVDFPAMEREVLAWWQDNDIMQKYLKRNEESDKRYSFIDGPITANNPMGAHHAWGRTYKDLFLRYKNMQGYMQRFQNGYDGQGLWIEVEVEKELGFKSKLDIESYGIGRFVELCKERVRKFADVITRQSIRLGYWMDWDNSYHTMADENNYTIWHFLKTCHQRGWIYEGRDVMPWCPRCSAGLSQHEIVTDGYKEIVHPGLFVRFPIEGRSHEALLVWTTTPWTLTSNTAAAVHPKFTYVKVRQGEEVLYLAKARLSALRGDYEVLEELLGLELVGLRYQGPFDELSVQQGVEHRVIPWDEVTESEGTGIVHSAPGAGKEDFALGKEFGLATIAPLDDFGVFVEGFDWLTGKSVFEVNDGIYDSLRQKGILYHLERYTHRYPHCWRCDTEVVFRLVDEWFISMEPLREPISEVAKKVRWIPGFGLQRELDWLLNMDDWMISKKRYYGLALPIYKCQCGHFDVIGSEQELEERAVEGWQEFKGHSPHRPWIDAVKIRCTECGAKLSRILDVGNPWLDAGIVPFSTLGYRHDREYWREWFPADWISESFPGQFRNWFYSLLTMGTVLESSEPFRAVFSYAEMRGEKGEDMHKSKGNAIWFEDAAEHMGVDAMRWLFARHNPAANLNFGYGTADEVRRRFIIPLWNVYSFFVTYANIDQYDPSTPAPEVERRTELDRWIISELNTLVAEVVEALDGFEPDRAARAAEHFVEYLSNWYVRRSRRRFWKSGVVGQADGADEDKLSAYATLYECLVTLVRLLAPFMPFMTEAMYQNLVRSADVSAHGEPVEPSALRQAQDEREGWESVHLESYPQPDRSRVDQRLSDATRLAMRLASLGRAARSKAGIKVRQPILKMDVTVREAGECDLFLDVLSYVMDELNVKELAAQVTFSEDTASQWFDYQIKPRLDLLGPKYGSKLEAIASALTAMESWEVARVVQKGDSIQVAGRELLPDEIEVVQIDKPGWVSASEGGYVVRLFTEISPELALEGLARELVHRIQNMRRSAGFDISDYIVTYYQGDAKLEEVMAAHGDYIRQETLSRQVVNGPPAQDAYTETHRVDGFEAVLGVKKEV